MCLYCGYHYTHSLNIHINIYRDINVYDERRETERVLIAHTCNGKGIWCGFSVYLFQFFGDIFSGGGCGQT